MEKAFFSKGKNTTSPLSPTSTGNGRAALVVASQAATLELWGGEPSRVQVRGRIGIGEPPVAIWSGGAHTSVGTVVCGTNEGILQAKREKCVLNW